MSPPPHMADLEKLAASLELYGRREAILAALRAGRLESAAAECKQAMDEAAYRARYNCAPIGPEAHKQQFLAIKELRSAIRSAGSPH